MVKMIQLEVVGFSGELGFAADTQKSVTYATLPSEPLVARVMFRKQPHLRQTHCLSSLQKVISPSTLGIATVLDGALCSFTN